MSTNEFWKGRRVFVTNPASFRGAWLCLHLLNRGAQVFGFGGNPKTVPSLFEIESLALKIGFTFGDLRDHGALREALNFSEAEVVIHTGADFSLKESRDKSLECISEEVMGTATLLECLRETATVRALVVLSSDRVYARQGAVALTEESPVAAGEISPTSKLCAEMVALSYREQFFSPEKFNKHKVALAVARVGSAIGGGDFAEDSLVAQAAKAFSSGVKFEVKKPQSVRSWIHIDDQVAGVLCLAEALVVKGPKVDGVWNVGAGETASVGEFAKLFAHSWGDSLLMPMDSGTSGTSVHPVLSSEKIGRELGWKPQLTLSSGVKLLVEWYKDFYPKRR
ncbi:CDP-glucose 4,6-dehydratase [compost metagenome]